MVFEHIGKLLARTSVQLLVMLLTLVLLILGAYGTSNLRMEFRPEWLVDPEAESMNDQLTFFKETNFSHSLVFYTQQVFQ